MKYERQSWPGWPDGVGGAAGGLRKLAAGAIVAVTVLGGRGSVAVPAVAEPVRALAELRSTADYTNHSAEPGAVSLVAVFGQDQRRPLPAKYLKLRDGLGVLFNMRSKTVCSAFCVGNAIVATAAHCIYRTAGEETPRPQDFWFARNYDTVRTYARIGGYDTGSAAQHIAAGSTKLSTEPPIDATRDWAIIKLSRPLCQGHVFKVAPMSVEAINTASVAGEVFQLSYHRDFVQWRPAYSQPCKFERSFGRNVWSAIQKDFSAPENLLLHTCDTGGASSGSPIFHETAQGPRVVGINVGTYVLSRVLTQNGAVTRKLASDTVANTGVAVLAFATTLEAMRSAEILVGPIRIRELQTLLTERGFDAGGIDGTYGAGLKAAIESYETSQKRPPTGLATEALLEDLLRNPAAGRGADKRAR